MDLDINKLHRDIEKYLEFKNSPEYGEDYKYEFFENNKINLDDIENFAENYKNVESKAGNFLPFHLKNGVVMSYIVDVHKDKIIKLLIDLYDINKEIGKRVDDFIDQVYNIILSDDLWDSKGMGKINYTSVSFLLSFYDYKEYLFIGKAKEYTELYRDYNLDKKKYGKYGNSDGELYKNWLDLANSILLPELQKYIPTANMLDVQDFIYCRNGYEVKNEDKVGNKNNTQTNYWIYAPGNNADRWDEFYQKGIMAIGWPELGDLSKYTNKDEIRERLTEITGKKNPKNDATACDDFVNNIKKGDIVIAKRGLKEYIGYGIVEGDYEYIESNIDYKNIRKISWKSNGSWEEKGLKQIALKTLTDITKYPDYVERLKNQLNIGNITEPGEPKNKKSILLDTKKQIILYGPPGTGKTYNTKNIIENHSGEDYDSLTREGRVKFITFHQSYSYEEFVEGIKPSLDGYNLDYNLEDGIFKEIALKAKNNYNKSLSNRDEYIDLDKLIKLFQNHILDKIDKGEEFILDKKITIKEISEKGTFITGGSVNSQNLAISIIERDYLDFKSGKINDYRDITPSRESKRGFHGNARYYFMLYKKIRAFEKSLKNTDIKESYEPLKPYYLIIDEINRGNISRIFGELITLLETDKRIGGENEIKATLPYSKKDFSIPKNLYIIATMNTSDRSIIALDTALRRRFGFVEMLPDYSLLEDIEIEDINLAELLQSINNKIEKLIDKDHLIGHSYLMEVQDIEQLKQVFDNEIYLLLEEYFYQDITQIENIIGRGFFKGGKYRSLEDDEFMLSLNEIIDDDEEI